MAEPASPFRGRTAAWLYAVGIGSFACAIGLAVLGPATDRGSAGADSFSRSALGHRAFVELLRDLDLPVLLSEHASLAKAGPRSVLVVAEPREQPGEPALLDDLLDAPAVLLVLPKWSGRPSETRPGWLDSTRLLSRETVEEVLSRVVADGEIVRSAGRVSFAPGALEARPELARPQLMWTEQLEPVVAGPSGMLVGRYPSSTQDILVLSDPDVLSNHGIGLGENALLAVRLVESLLEPGGVVVVDETTHGHRRSVDPWQVLLEFPYVAATVQVLVATLVLLWAVGRRFGTPARLGPALEPGKQALIDNTAALLDYGGHGPAVVRRYLAGSLRDLARRLNAPRGLDDDALWRWMARLGTARGLPLAVDREAGASAPRGSREWNRQLVDAAAAMHRWKKEMLDGRRFG